jgi:phosphoserine phosphatase
MASPLSHVATLICNPQAPVLTDALVGRAQKTLGGAGAARWLSPGAAVDIGFEPDDSFDRGALAAALVEALDDAPVDIVLQPAEGRRKKLFVADMDSTIIGQECIDELADLVGLKARVSAITERAMRGEIAFEPALRERVGLLAGLKADVVADVIAHRITLTPGARTLVRTMRANGAYTALVSGGFTAFTNVIADMVGFDENRANRLVVEAGKFAGRVEDPILGADAKLASLKELRQQHGLSRADTLAAGDGANDLPMLREAGLGIAYHAKPAVAAAADARIDNSDLTALLFAQGYSRDEFVD